MPANQQALPVFFGTSSAAPNAAAVAALMLEKVPELTPAQIRTGLEDTATPMNGQTPGTWVAADGYGLVNAINAINAVDLLRVSSTNPASGATVTVTPSAITVTFNKAVNFSTMSAADLTFTAMPTGVTVNVGAPIAVDNRHRPDDRPVPVQLHEARRHPGQRSLRVLDPESRLPQSVVSEDGKDLVASGPIKFTLADITAPVVITTTATAAAASRSSSARPSIRRRSRCRTSS